MTTSPYATNPYATNPYASTGYDPLATVVLTAPQATAPHGSAPHGSAPQGRPAGSANKLFAALLAGAVAIGGLGLTVRTVSQLGNEPATEVGTITTAGVELASDPGLVDPPLRGNGGNGEGVDTTTATDHDGLRRATVLITAGRYSGSGAVVSADGLIVTNAHVVAPDAMGQGVLYGDRETALANTPARVGISMSKGVDEPAELAYEAEVVAVDGYLDLAILQIVRTSGGKIVAPEDLNLTHVELGDSTSLPQDAAVLVLGYPGIADTDNVTMVRGTVASFVADERIRDNRAFISSTAPIAGGNSGGLAVDSELRMIGIPTSERFDSSERDSFSRFRPLHLALPLLDEARTHRTGDAPFRTDEHAPAPGGKETTGDNTLIRPLGSAMAFEASCQGAQRSSTISNNVVGVAIPYQNFGEGLDVRVDIRKDGEDQDEIIGSVSNRRQVDATHPEDGCLLVAVPLAEKLEADTTYRIDVLVGGNYHDLGNNGVFSIG